MNNNMIKSKRTFIIGDEWLYYKLYCGPKTADEILTQVVKPVVNKLLSDSVIDKWFFIRYSDPKLHLRVRFHYTKPENIFFVINSLKEATTEFVENDLLWKIQIDTYQRELERYGNSSIELAEELFFHDSEMIVNFIDLIEGDEGELIRWLFALRSVDNLLNDFSYDISQKINLLSTLREGFGNEFGMNKMLKLQLDKKFRNSRQEISDIFEGKYGSEDIDSLIELLNNRSLQTQHIAQEILIRNKNNKLERPLNDLMGSYIHMLMNRLFKSKQRIHEMVIYDFLYRYYKSELAKKKHKPKVEKVSN